MKQWLENLPGFFSSVQMFPFFCFFMYITALLLILNIVSRGSSPSIFIKKSQLHPEKDVLQISGYSTSVVGATVLPEGHMLCFSFNLASEI
jgi:hypothetical protein